MNVLDGDGVDADVVEGVGVDGLRPEDSGGVDGAIDHEVLRDCASKQSNSVVVTFLFSREEFVIVSTQENGDLS